MDCITGTAVLECGPAETLSPVGARSPAYPRLWRPRHLPWPADPREKPASRPRRVTSCERRTVRWREPDSNYWSRDGETPLGTQCGLRARLHQHGEALIPGETKSSNPVSSSGESCKPPIPRRVLSLGGTARHQRFDERLAPQRAGSGGAVGLCGPGRHRHQPRGA